MRLSPSRTAAFAHSWFPPCLSPPAPAPPRETTRDLEVGIWLQRLFVREPAGFWHGDVAARVVVAISNSLAADRAARQ